MKGFSQLSCRDAAWTAYIDSDCVGLAAFYTEKAEEAKQPPGIIARSNPADNGLRWIGSEVASASWWWRVGIPAKTSMRKLKRAVLENSMV